MVYYDTTVEMPDTVDELAREIADAAIGTALDNGHDMGGTNPEEHLAVEWRGYIQHHVDVLLEEGTPTPIDAPPVIMRVLFEHLCEQAEAVAPAVAAESGKTLYDPIPADD